MVASIASMGHQSKCGVIEEVTYGFGIGGTSVAFAAAVPLAVTRQLVFSGESIAKRGNIMERDGLRGTRSHVSEDTRIGPIGFGGSLALEPTPEDLAVILPWILGADVSTQTFAVDETLQSFTCQIDRVAKCFAYTGCVISRATFSGQTGGYIRLNLDIVAQYETITAAGTFPSLTASITTPFIFNGDPVLTLASAARECSSFELVIDNGVVPDRFMNSLYIINAPTGDRTVTLSATVPYASANTDLYNQALAGATGSLVLTCGNYSMTCTFATLQCADQSPVVQGRGEIPLTLNMVARKLSTTKEIVIVLDSTP